MKQPIKFESVWDVESKQMREAFDKKLSKLMDHQNIDSRLKLKWLDDAMLAVDKLIDEAMGER